MPVTFGTTLPPILPVQTQFHLAVMLEKFGFDNVWLPDHALFPDGTEAPDCWSVGVRWAPRRLRWGASECPGPPDGVRPSSCLP